MRPCRIPRACGWRSIYMSLRLRFRRRGLWQKSDFLKLWVGQTVSKAGSLVTGFALPLAAIVLLHASAAQVALLSAAGVAPGAVVGVGAGGWGGGGGRRAPPLAAGGGRGGGGECGWIACGGGPCCSRRMSGGRW